MSEQDWAQEPWELYRYDVDDRQPAIRSGGEHIRIHSPWQGDAFEHDGSEEATANLDRIVACVNACEGVPTKWLESLTDGEIKEFIEEHITKEAPDES